MLDCRATEVDDPTEDPRFGRIGKQTIRDTGPLDRKRMETVDDEFLARAEGFMTAAVKEEKPFCAWYAPTRMHIYTRLRPGREALAAPHSSEMDIFGSGMMELDLQVGQLLKKLDELGVAARPSALT